MDSVQLLTSKSDLVKAHVSFHQLFRGGNPIEEPFHDHGWPRGMLYPAEYQLSDEHFHALSVAAASVGEYEAFASEIEAYDGFDFEDGRGHAVIDLRVRSLDLPVPYFSPVVETAIYSCKGTWGVLTSQHSIAVVTGIPSFMVAIEAELHLHDQLEAFVHDFRSARYPLGDTSPWVPNLIEHLVGEATAARLLQKG